VHPQNSSPRAIAAQALQAKHRPWRKDERAIVKWLLTIEHEKDTE
jgi:hypothetical protein